MPEIGSEPAEVTTSPLVFEDWIIVDEEEPDDNLLIYVDGTSLDVDSGEDQATFNPLGRESYVVLSDAVKGETFSIDIQVDNWPAYDQLEKLRRKQKILLLQSPIRGKQWYFRFGKKRERWQNVAHPYVLISYEIKETAPVPTM